MCPQILAARSAQPSEYFTPFMGRLSDTVREQIADCAAASYGSLSIPAAQKLMMFDSTAELGAYLQQHRVSSGSVQTVPVESSFSCIDCE